MATWIPVEDTVFEHHKIIAAAAQLRISEVHLVGCMVSLWLFTLRHAWRDGDLKDWGDDGIARAAKWTTDPVAFVQCLRSVGLLDDYAIHNWIQRAGQIVRDRLRKERERSRKLRGRSRKVPERRGLSAVSDPIRSDPIREDPTGEKEKRRGANGSRETRPSHPRRTSLITPEWIGALKGEEVYAGLDVDRELAKMRQWCQANGKGESRRRFVNWLNRAERPAAGSEPDYLAGIKAFSKKMDEEEKQRGKV